MPSKKLKESQELAVLKHPKMSRYHNKKEKIKKGQKILRLSAPFTSYYDLLFSRTKRREPHKFKGHQYDAAVFEFVKIQSKSRY